MIIDFCVHPACIWEIPETLQVRIKQFYPMEYGKSLKFTEEELIHEMDVAGTDIGVVRSQNNGGIGYQAPNDKVMELIKRHPDRLVGLGSVDPTQGTNKLSEKSVKTTIDEFERLMEMGFKGLIFYPQYYFAYPNDELLYPLYEKVVEYDVPIAFIAYWSTRVSKIKYGHPALFDDIAVDFPDIKIVVDALGGGNFEDMYAVASKNLNVFMTTSACPFIYPGGLFEHHMKVILDSWIPMDRVLYAAEYPLSSAWDTRRMLEDMGMSLDVKRKVFGENAAKLLKI
jgi:predicted TIM-barrel fold metal-dependent hydrolase